MKITIKRSCIATLALAALAGSANAATITMTVSNIDWNANMWGPGPSAPTSGNDYVTAVTGNNVVRLSAAEGNTTFGGGSLEVVSGTRALLKNQNSTSTINGDLILSGGLVDLGPNSDTAAPRAGTLDVTNFVVSGTGSRLGAGEQVALFTIDGTLTGSGDLEIFSQSLYTGTTGATVAFTGISAFTGAITLNSNTNGLNLDFGTVTYAFSNSLSIDTDSVLNVNSGQTLTFDLGDLIDPLNGAVAAGTYSGASLDALGANYANNGGTLVVVPEPSSVLLLGSLGGLALLRRRRS